MAQIKKISTELQPLDKLLDTSGDAGTSGQVLSSTGSGTNWIAAGGSGTVTGSGTTNYIPMWTSSTALGNSVVFQTGTNRLDALVDTLELSNDWIIQSTDGNYWQRIRTADGSPTTTNAFNFETRNGSGSFINHMTILNSGNVGIGTVSPQAKVEIADTTNPNLRLQGKTSNGANSGTLEFRENDTNYGAFVKYNGDANIFQLGTRYGGSDYARMTILRDTGYVGINITSPPQLLTISGDANYMAHYDGSNYAFMLGADSSGDGNFELFNSSGTKVIKIYAEAGSANYINNGGSVGIGTSTPGTNLDIQGSAAQSLRVKSDGQASIIIDSDGDNSGIAGAYLHYRDTGATKWTLYKETNNDFYLHNAAASTYPIHAKANGHIVLMEDGNNLGVGISSPAYKLDVAGTMRVKDGNSAVAITEYSNGATIWLDGSNGDFSGGDYFNISAYGTTDLAFGYAAGTKMTLKDTGRLGIGTTAPNEILEVSGNIRASGSYKVGATEVISSGRRFYSADGSAASPAYSFSGFTDDGMYREVYDTTKSTISFSTEGARRGRIGEFGIWSDANVYATNQFRMFGTWQATNGTTGGGFTFLNTADNSSAVLLSITSVASAATDSVATFSGKVVSAQTASSDGNGVLTTKSYVDGLVTGVTRYMGLWDASSGTGGNPDLTASTYKVAGYYFICDTAGDAEPNGAGTEPDTWHVGDWIIYSSDLSAWQKIDNTSVLSGSGTANKVAMWNGDESLTNAPITISTNDATFAGTVSAEDNIHLTDAGTVRAKLLLNSSDRDNVELRAESIGSTMKFFTVGTEALVLNASQNATFAGDLTVTGTDIRTGASNGLDLGDDSSIVTIGRTNELWTQNDTDADATLYVNYRGYSAASTRFRSLDIRDGKAAQIAVFHGPSKMTTLQGGVAVNYGGSNRLSISGDVNVIGATDFTIPQGRKIRLDGGGGHTYITEESDSNLKFYVAGSEQLNITNTAATFTGDIKQSTRTTLHDNGTMTWGAANDYGNLTWDTGYALIGGLSGKGLKLFTSGSSNVALTLDTSQNATFAGNIILDDNSGASPNIQFINEDNNSWYIYNDSNGKFQVQQSSDIRATFSSGDLEVRTPLKVSAGAVSISGDGSNYATLTETGAGLLTIAAVDDVVLDAGGDIALDAAGFDIRLRSAGTTFGKFTNQSSNLQIKSLVSNKDIVISGVDDGTEITALTLDMSDAGKATFNNGWSSDGQATEYTWRIPNTSSNDGHWYKIARVTSIQSTRFKLQMVGGHSYSDGYYSSEVNAYGQLNNDNNYDLIYYRLEKEFQNGNPIISFGQVDVDNNSTDLYVRLNTFAELVITASLSNGDLYPDDTSTGSSTTPTNFVSALEQFGVLSPTKFQGTVRFNSQILDKDGDAGTSGQLLSSTGSQVDWVSASSVIGGPYLPLTGGTITGALSITGDGSNAVTLTESGNGDFTIDAPDDIRLDAGGGDIVLRDDGLEFGRLSNGSSNLQIRNINSDKDILFKGNDGGTTITALTLDMSDAGTATFNNIVDALTFRAAPSNNGAIIMGQNSTSAQISIFPTNGETWFQQGAAGGTVRFQADNFTSETFNAGETLFTAAKDGAVTLYYDNSVKLATTQTGVEITSNLYSPQISINDYISHNGDTNSYFGFDAADSFKLVIGGSTVATSPGSSISLYAGGNTKLATTSVGITVIGKITASSIAYTPVQIQSSQQNNPFAASPGNNTELLSLSSNSPFQNVSSPNAMNYYVAPQAGRIAQVVLRNVKGTPVSHSTRIRIYKNGANGYNSSYLTGSGTNAVGWYVDFDNINHTFSQYDRIQIAFQGSNSATDWKDFAMTIVVEFSDYVYS